MANQSTGFWSSLQGILTGLAAVITALTGLYLAVKDDVANVTPAEPPIVAVAEPAAPVADKPKLSHIVHPITVIKQPIVRTLPKQVLATIPVGRVNCALFPTKNTSRSLMSWSTHYQQKVIDAKGNKARASDPCIKTLRYRAQAHCLDTSNKAIEKSLNNTLAHCQEVGVSWRDAVTP